jgi:hypothetical protein
MIENNNDFPLPRRHHAARRSSCTATGHPLAGVLSRQELRSEVLAILG